MPVDLSRVTIKENAQYEELKAFFVLSSSLLQNGRFIIGDDIPHGKPDIYATDNSIGVEVVTIELKEAFYHPAYKTDLKIFRFFDKPNKEFVLPNASTLHAMLKNEKLKLKYKQYRKSKSQPKLIAKERSLYYKEFTKLITKKLNKLKYNHYNGCKKTCLFIQSNFAYKDFLNVNKLQAKYKEISKNYKKQFDTVLINFNDNLHNLKTGKKINYEHQDITQNFAIRSENPKYELAIVPEKSI